MTHPTLAAVGATDDHLPPGWVVDDVVLLVTAGYPVWALTGLHPTGLTPEVTLHVLRTVHTLADHVPWQQMEHLVAEHRVTPATTEVRDLLTTVPHPDAAALADAPAPVIAALLAGHPTPGTVSLRYLLAYAADADPTLLTHLAGDPVWSVRAGVARNPTTPPDVLTTLARGTDVIVRANVAANPHTPPDALTALAQGADAVVRAVVAANPHTPPSVLTVLAGDPDSAVRQAALTNPRTPPTPPAR